MTDPIDGWRSLGKITRPEVPAVTAWKPIATAHAQPNANEMVRNVLSPLYVEKMPVAALLALGTEFVPTLVEAANAHKIVEKMRVGSAKIEEERVSCANACIVRRPIVPQSGESLLENCEDAAGIVVGPDGAVKSFAIADGVSECLNGKVAAVLAVKEALASQNQFLPHSGIAGIVHKKVKDVTDWDEYGREYRKKKAAGIKDLDPMMATVQRMKLSVNESGELVEPKNKKVSTRINAVAATTLLVGKIENGNLLLSKIGNMVCVVISANGNIVRFGTGKESNQLQVKDSAVEGEELLIHPLAQGDRIFAFSDGLFINNVEECMQILRSSYKNTKEEVINSLMSRVGHDDCVILAIDY